MYGFCSHCHVEGTVWRYRVWTVGLRFMGRDCADRLAAMGLDIEPVTTADPRQTPRRPWDHVFRGGRPWEQTFRDPA